MHMDRPWITTLCQMTKCKCVPVYMCVRGLVFPTVLIQVIFQGKSQEFAYFLHPFKM